MLVVHLAYTTTTILDLAKKFKLKPSDFEVHKIEVTKHEVGDDGMPA